jgi:hypothetical protein
VDNSHAIDLKADPGHRDNRLILFHARPSIYLRQRGNTLKPLEREKDKSPHAPEHGVGWRHGAGAAIANRRPRRCLGQGQTRRVTACCRPLRQYIHRGGQKMATTQAALEKEETLAAFAHAAAVETPPPRRA